MLEELNERLRQLDEMNGVRRQSMWQQSSIGSVPSSNGSIGSIAYSSPAQRLAQVAASYQQTPPPMRQTPSFGENSQPSAVSTHIGKTNASVTVFLA